MKVHKLSKSNAKFVGLLVACCVMIVGVFIYLAQHHDTYEIVLKPLKETASIYRVDDDKLIDRYWIYVKKNGVDVVSSAFMSGNFPKEQFKVSAIESHEPSYRLTQTQFETLQAFRKDPVRQAAFHKANVTQAQKRYQTIEFMDENQKVVTKTKLEYIVIDDAIAKLPDKAVMFSVKVGSKDSDQKIKAMMGAFKGDLNDDEFTDSFTGKYDIKTVGSYTLTWERTLKRSGLKSKQTINLKVE